MPTRTSKGILPAKMTDGCDELSYTFQFLIRNLPSLSFVPKQHPGNEYVDALGDDDSDNAEEARPADQFPDQNDGKN